MYQATRIENTTTGWIINQVVDAGDDEIIQPVGKVFCNEAENTEDAAINLYKTAKNIA